MRSEGTMKMFILLTVFSAWTMNAIRADDASNHAAPSQVTGRNSYPDYSVASQQSNQAAGFERTLANARSWTYFNSNENYHTPSQLAELSRYLDGKRSDIQLGKTSGSQGEIDAQKMRLYYALADRLSNGSATAEDLRKSGVSEQDIRWAELRVRLQKLSNAELEKIKNNGKGPTNEESKMASMILGDRGEQGAGGGGGGGSESEEEKKKKEMQEELNRQMQMLAMLNAMRARQMSGASSTEKPKSDSTQSSSSGGTKAGGNEPAVLPQVKSLAETWGNFLNPGGSSSGSSDQNKQRTLKSLENPYSAPKAGPMLKAPTL